MATAEIFPSGCKSPTIDTLAVPNCPVCQGTLRERIATGADYEYQTCGNEWHMWQCSVCEHAWLDPRPTLEMLPIIYPENYYSYDYEKRINKIALKGKSWLDARKFKKIISFLKIPLKNYLDVGCGTGRFLALAENFGVERKCSKGIELSKPPVEKLVGDGYVVEHSPVESSVLVSEGNFDLVTMFHVIEHVSDPAAVIAKLASSINPGGLLVIETPNSRSLDAKLFRDGFWGGYHFPRHWHIFNPHSIAILLERSGFSVLSTQFQPGHSFWLFSFHHVLKYGRRRYPVLANMVHPLRSLPGLIAVTGFDLLRAFLGFRTSAMMIVAKKNEISCDI